jgi:hypothetical protein
MEVFVMVGVWWVWWWWACGGCVHRHGGGCSRVGGVGGGVGGGDVGGCGGVGGRGCGGVGYVVRICWVLLAVQPGKLHFLLQVLNTSFPSYLQILMLLGFLSDLTVKICSCVRRNVVGNKQRCMALAGGVVDGADNMRT